MSTPSPASNITERHFPDAASAAEVLADDIGELLRSALEKRGLASLVVSGGKSPVPFFNALRRQAVDWARVWVTLADERWVDPKSPDSNERLLREHLLVEAASTARFVGLKSDFPTAQAGLAASIAAFAVIPRPFDAVVLGMGEDGHTASLFPGAAGLEAALDPDGTAALAAIEAPVAPHARITMTMAALLDARQLFLPVHGSKKRAVYAAARAAPNVGRYPIEKVLRQTTTAVTVEIIEP